MKKSFLKVLALGLVASAVMFGCKKDETNPDYVGTWSQSATEGKLTSKMKIVFTKDSYDFSFIMNDVQMGGEKGSVAVSGNTMTLTTTEVAVVKLDPVTGKTSVTYYKDGTPEFTKEQGSDPKTVKGEYIVAGNKITLSTDNNGDGKYTGTEVQILTKE